MPRVKPTQTPSDSTSGSAPSDSTYHIKAKSFLLTYYVDEQPLPSFVDKLSKQLDGRFYTVASEICPTTDRFHIHLYVHASTQMDMAVTYWNVDGVQPDCMPNTTTGSGFWNACCRGHFYVECRHKIDHVTQHSNYPWETYRVPIKAQWIIGLWKGHKILTSRVRECLDFYRSATRYWLDVIHLALQYERTVAREAFHAKRQRVLEPTLAPFKSYPELEKFKLQYDLVLHRYKFLCVTGETNLGKTRLLLSHYPSAFVHDGAIDWTGYDPSQHTAIFVQDIRNWWDYVLTHKPLFQANSRNIKVHTSPTNCHSITIDVCAVPIIVITNDPVPQDLPDSDLLYIVSNSVELTISSVTYLAPP